MSLPARKPATYADLKALAPNLVGEIIHGALHAQPRPIPRHARAAYSLGGERRDPFDRGRGGPGGWIFLIEPKLHLGAHVLVPDLAGWRAERLTAFPETSSSISPPIGCARSCRHPPCGWIGRKRCRFTGSSAWGMRGMWTRSPRHWRCSR